MTGAGWCAVASAAVGKKPARKLDWLGQLRLKKQQQQQEAARLRVADRGALHEC